MEGAPVARVEDRRAAPVRGYGLAVLASPILAAPVDATAREWVTRSVAVLVAAGLAAATRRSSGPVLRWVGVALVAAAALLATVTPPGVAVVVIAVVLGGGTGLAVGGAPAVAAHRWSTAAGVASGLAVLGAVRVLAGPGRPVHLASVLVVGSAAAALSVLAVVDRRTTATPSVPADGDARGDDLVDGAASAGVGAVARPARPRHGRATVGVVVALAVGLVMWTAANDPQVRWFGPVTWHGDRSGRQVALTFDDGPNARWTRVAADELEAHGARGTFFLVGQAVAAEPAVARDLVARGHLVGNHSFHHDAWRWLDPRYPELARTQVEVERRVGVCPRFYRPPHGQRTPFVTAQVAARGMDTVTWDVSGADWSLRDPREVARRILRRVRPGSIVLLHDSLDGRPDADRRVLAQALPLILDGLRERGLRPVRLDELLGGPAYLPDRDC